MRPTFLNEFIETRATPIADRMSKNDLRAAVSEDLAVGRLPAGDVIDELAIADRFGVSRTPIREVLHGLAATGHVEHQPGRGFRAPRLDLGIFRGYLRTAEAFLPGAFRAAMARETDEIRLLRTERLSAVFAAGATGDVEGFVLSLARFNDAIVEATGNPLMIRSLEPLMHEELRLMSALLAPLGASSRAAAMSGIAVTADALSQAIADRCESDLDAAITIRLRFVREGVKDMMVF